MTNQPASVAQLDTGFQAGPTFPTIPTFPYFIFVLLLFPTFF